jgi:hypothetical protein
MDLPRWSPSEESVVLFVALLAAGRTLGDAAVGFRDKVFCVSSPSVTTNGLASSRLRRLCLKHISPRVGSEGVE